MTDRWRNPRWKASEPVHFVMPAGAKSTSWGEVEALAVELGIVADVWQAELGRAVLAADADGRLLAETVALSVPRQSGKSFMLALLVFADCWNHPNRTAVWSAHAFKPALEVFTLMRDWALQLGVSRRDIKTAAGNESIVFDNGSRIVFAARARGVVRGFSAVSRLVLDEAQILSTRVMSDLVSTTRVAERPQVLLAGTPPKPGDDCEVFAGLRAQALAAESSSLLWAEWAAPADADIDDLDVWATANPSTRTPNTAIERERRLLTVPDFKREALGIWPTQGETLRVIASDVWDALVGIGPPDGTEPTALAVDMSHDRVAAVAACWTSEDGEAHVELVALDHAGDTFKLVEWLVGKAGRRIPVYLDPIGPAGSIVPALEARHVRLTQTTATDMSKACGLFYDDVHAGRLSHIGQPQLDDALVGARRRAIGAAGGWGWDRKAPEVDIAPLVAVTLARYGGSKRRARNQGSSRRAVLL